MTPPGTIALTGGSGFIGRRFTAAARTRGYHIRHLARDTSGLADSVQFDLDRDDPADDALRGCAALVHLAAHIPRDHDDPAEATRCWRINAQGTLRLVEAAARAGIDRIVQTASANAYAQGDVLPAETAALFPRSRGYYLGSKILQEIYATELCRRHGVALSTLRLASVYGPGQTSGVVGAMLRAAMDGAAIRVADGGRFGADLVFVDDVVDALIRVLGSDCTGPLNVGSGVRTTTGTLATRIARMTGRDGDVIVEPPRPDGSDSGFPALDITRLRALGYTPVSLSVGLAATIGDRRAQRSFADLDERGGIDPGQGVDP